MTLYSNFFSSAINSVEINEKVVKITYSSNLEKTYEYKCCLLYTSPSPRDPT